MLTFFAEIKNSPVQLAFAQLKLLPFFLAKKGSVFFFVFFFFVQYICKCNVLLNVNVLFEQLGPDWFLSSFFFLSKSRKVARSATRVLS